MLLRIKITNENNKKINQNKTNGIKENLILISDAVVTGER